MELILDLLKPVWFVIGVFTLSAAVSAGVFAGIHLGTRLFGPITITENTFVRDAGSQQ